MKMGQFSLFMALVFVLLGTTKGECVEEGIRRQNNSSWKKDSCTSCFCNNGVITCNRKRCKDPQCDITKGEALVISTSGCCPVCSMTSERHCIWNEEIVAHNTEWRGSNCTTCTCTNGDIKCSPIECETAQCGYGEIPHRVDGVCCPICVSVEKSCKFEGKTFRDGTTWNPSECERAYCNKGEVVRHIAYCDNIVCGSGEIAIVLKDECCPSCVGRSCVYQGHEYSSGEQFQGESCHQCICQSGEVTCVAHHCDVAVDRIDSDCSQGGRRHTRREECCPECISTQESCDYHGNQYFHGDLWNISKCEVAICSHGNVRSMFVQCSPVKCGWNETLIYGSCCPECVAVTTSCRHNDLKYRHGDVWKAGSCSRCECIHGMTQCFNAECPTCPTRTIPVEVPGECCSDCQPVACHSDCVTCDAAGYAHCTSCRRDRVLQEGKCLRKCSSGFYKHNMECKACHSSCGSCMFGDSPSSCTSCQSGMKLQNGRCLESCDVGYFTSGNLCKDCPKGCAACTNATLCLTCHDNTHIPQDGACVRECEKKFFYKNGRCRACHSSCATCNDDSSCINCPLGKLKEGKLCVDRCTKSFYQLSISRCAACHESCDECSGPSSSHCTSCKPISYLYTGKCISTCPPKHYPLHGQCESCHSSCQSCTEGSAHHCITCASSKHVIKDGICVNRCDKDQYLNGATCQDCDSSCSTCNHANSCNTCKPSTALVVTSQRPQLCVTEKQCTRLSLVVDSSLLLCYNSSAVEHCYTEGRHLSGNECVADCPLKAFAMQLPSGMLCIPCSPECSRCQSNGECLSCESGYFFSNISRKCVEVCEPGYYTSSGNCLVCPSPCATCVLSSVSPQPVCTSCRDVTAVLQSGRCSSRCFDQFYPDASNGSTPVCKECDWSCTRCYGSSHDQCLECMGGKKLEEGSCVQQCSSGYYHFHEECRPCSVDNCDLCSDADNCIRCRSPYFHYENSCLTSCPRGYYSDPISRSCQSCPAHCLLCPTDNACSQCDERTFLIDRSDPFDHGTKSNRTSHRRLDTSGHNLLCVRRCGHGYYGNTQTRKCEINRRAPFLSIGGRLLVGIGSRVVVNQIMITDNDDDVADLFLTLVMTPANGWFELNKSRVPTGSNIPYHQVAQGSLWFVHDSTRQRYGVAMFQANDRQLTSQQMALEIITVSTMKPVIVLKKPVIVSVGESVKISAQSYLQIKDDDNANDVTIDVIYPPKYGVLVKLPNYEEQINKFKIRDLDSDVIMYVTHGNITSSRMLHDTITLQISDGYHVINSVLHVDVISRVQTTGFLLGNKAAHVRRGGLTRITDQQLLTIATNIKDKSKIVYVIKPRENKGNVVLMVPEMSDAPIQYGISMNDWRSSQGHYQSPPRIRFSQRDVDEGFIWYHDLGQEEDENEIEAFEFEVYDESRDPVEPIGRDEFRVTYIHDNIQPPRPSHAMTSPPQMSADEGRISVLHNGYLHYIDDDTSDRNIIYNITRAIIPGFGTIENSNHPYVPISVFTQADVDSNKIIYRPPTGGIPNIPSELGRRHSNDGGGYKYGHYRSPSSNGRYKIDFQFTISDGEHTLPPVNFTIKVASVTTSPPSFINRHPSLEVGRGGTSTIGDVMLAVRDPDTQPRDLIYTLVKAPRHGTVIRNDQDTRVILKEGDSFNYAEIQRNSLHYMHNGDSEENDQVQISVTDGTDVITEVIQITITRSTRRRGPTPHPHTELSLVVTESSEAILSRENLAFVEPGSRDDQIVYHIETEPVHGLLLSADDGPLVPGSTFTQRDIDLSKIRYHSRGDIGSFSVSDNIRFRVSDASGSEMADQLLTITIKPSLHQPPKVTLRDPFVVHGTELTRMTSHHIVVSDVDTTSQDLIISVLRKPTHGNIVTTRDLPKASHHEDVWFTVKDMLDGSIYYKYEDESENNIDYFTFRVNDGYSSTLTYRLNVTIEFSNKIIPSIRTDTVICQSGHAMLIRNVSIAVVDSDTPNSDLVFTVTSALRYGKLVKFAQKLPHDMLQSWKVGIMKKSGGNGTMMKKSEDVLRVGSTFTYQDVVDQKICYENTQTFDYDPTISRRRRRRDTLSFVVSDGSSQQTGELDIEVEPEPPENENELTKLKNTNQMIEHPTVVYPTNHILSHVSPAYEELQEAEWEGVELMVEANTGMTVERGSITAITSEELRVSGTKKGISYVITRDPNVGQLQYASDNIVANISADGDNEFTQDEIDNGKIHYYHPVSQGGGEVFFMFDVIGGMVDLQFNIHVNEDNSPPKILKNIGLIVKEGGSKSIRTQQLSASDESGRVTYVIIQPPKLGRIELTNKPGRPIESFTQDDVMSGAVQYVHTSDTERTDDQIIFSVTDGTNSITQTFNIRVLAVDNSLPVLENVGIRVQEGVRKTITEFELKATDRDTNNELIRFNVVTLPQHGSLDRTTNGKHYVQVTSFTMDDIYESRISYNHDGTNSLTDSFTFTVNDGTNDKFVIHEEGNIVPTTQAQEFPIRVLPVDDGTPRLITNLGINHLEYMDNKALSVITKRSLLTEDPDTPPDRIIYTLTSDPRHGHLESTLNSGEPIRTFTQADINTGLIRYVLSDVTTSATRDSFMFNVRDSLPNVVVGNTFNVRWSVISFEKSNYNVSEESHVIDIRVLRRGNLNQYAIVLCRTEHGTATSSVTDSASSNGQLDYIEHAGQVQFDEYETEKTCSVQINNDLLYEGTESFIVELTMPTYALLGNITRASVHINDDEDIPTLQFVETQYTVEERDTAVFIPIKRTGDIEKATTIICYTLPRSATGSVKGRIESGSDYKSRERHSGESIVTFAPGVSSVTCNVKIIDDSIYEDSEEFIVRLTDASGGAKVGKFSEATVTITGPNDSPSITLSESRFVYNEDAGTVDIPVHRSGPDLSFSTDVWCSTKQNDPVSATAGEDFVATSTKITFRSDETAKMCSLTILDDSQAPIVEGEEAFTLHLNSVQRGHLSTPHEALVIINDTLNDVPKFQFMESSIEIKETVKTLSLRVQRVGDVSSHASVICYTRQNSATVEEDFVERPLTEMSRIVFQPGQRTARCNVTIVDDKVHESRETFTVRLDSATGDHSYGARIGETDVVQVTVTNDEDAPTLEFELSKYSIREPDPIDTSRQLSVTIVRTGDTSDVSKVRCSTRDGSAKSGSDYEPKSRMLRFQPGQTSINFKVNILSNDDTEWQETFLIMLGPNDPVNAVMGAKSQTTVTILDRDAAGSLILPSTPVVVSLLHYDNVAEGLKVDPPPGYPLICVTPCDPKYPQYVETKNLCEEAAINSSSIQFSWEVAMPTESGKEVPPFEKITDITPFTSVDKKVLDSIYFARRFHIRCVARAVDGAAHSGGTPLKSNVVTIATDSGLCHNPIVSGSERNFQAQSFIANLRYVPPIAHQHPNTLHVSVKIPHQDGRIPLISTMPLNNLRLLLSRTVDRQQHVCSNLLYSSETNQSLVNNQPIKRKIGTGLGFVEATDYSKLSLGPGYDKPYQLDPRVREARTIDLYKYLNLKSCIWQFDAYYHMNQLTDYCNGRVDSDFQVRDSAESQVTVTVPLYVSYVYVTAPRGWGALEHHTNMEFSFRYNNVLWRNGIQTDGVLSGRIQVLKIKIKEDGKLIIEFKTQTKFRGLFVDQHRTLPGRMSRVVPPEGMNIKFELTNMWTEPTYDSPFQIWQAVSSYSRKDYSGEYKVELIPCSVSPTQRWEKTVEGTKTPCTAYSPEEFKIPIMFQQTNRPVPVVYTLQTEFQLCNNEKVFMMDPKQYLHDVNDYDYKGAFTKGQTIFGRVLWTPDQDLRNAYELQLEKVYLCTGRDGYVPYFDPTGSVYGNGAQYGCIQPNHNLQHRFLLLDRSNRDEEDRKFHDVPFDAYFASDRPEYAEMSRMKGVDGFSIKVDGLYKVEAGHQWYIQVLYVIGPGSTLPRAKRSAMFGLSADTENKRIKRNNYLNENGDLSNRDILAAGWLEGEQNHNGTNMRGIIIDDPQLNSMNPLYMALASVAAFIALVLVLIFVCLRRRRRKKLKDAEFEMVARKMVAMRSSDDSDDDVCSSHHKYDETKIVNVTSVKQSSERSIEKNSQVSRVRVSNCNLNNCETPLIRHQDRKTNNAVNSMQPLLKRRDNLDIVNNLKEDRDSGTEV